MWYDKYLDGDAFCFWFGFGSEEGGKRLIKIIRDMAVPLEVGWELTKEDVVSQPFYHLREQLPVDLLAKPILEIYPKNWASGLGIYQTGRTVEFVRQATEFVELVLSGLRDLSRDEKRPLEDLRRMAIEAAKTVAQGKSQSSKGYYQRNATIRNYVLVRAKGLCQACGQTAPFNRRNKEPYLEPHHLEKLSDGGLDHPDNIAAVCPNCHREIHYGANGEELNARARQCIAQSRSEKRDEK